MARKKIYVLEDDFLSQLTFKRLLEKYYDFKAFSSADAFYEVFYKDQCDLIILDISLFGKTNGLEVTADLKKNEKYKHIPVICITAHAFQKDKVNALGAGVDEYFAKPVTNQLVMDTIKKYIGQ